MFTARAGELLQCASRPVVMDRRWKTSSEIAPNCPRCASPNTKFCYYNNYSLSQPRYFCKGCRRYWTKGGSLRNVPVGGGCRKNRRSKSVTRTPPPSDTFCRTLTSSNGGSGNPSSSIGTAIDAPNIDLAVVFAKFCNQNHNSCFDPGLHVLPAELPSHNQVAVEIDSPFSLTASSSSSDLPNHDSLPTQFPEEQAHAQQQQQQQGMLMIGCDDLLVTQDVLFIEGYEFGLEDQANTINPQYMEYPDPNGYGLQPILSEDFSQVTALWSETASPTVLQDFSWQTSQIQGLEPLVPPSADHNLTFHPNVLLNEDSGSFDLSSYGVS